jgi:hypothetical protein
MTKKRLLPEKEESGFDKRNVKILYTALSRYKKISGKPPLKKWRASFEKLRRNEGVDKERITSVLYWYVNHLRDKYTPKAYSGKSFREKFFDIEKAMQKDMQQGILFDDFNVVMVKDNDDEYEFEIDY